MARARETRPRVERLVPPLRCRSFLLVSGPARPGLDMFILCMHFLYSTPSAAKSRLRPTAFAVTRSYLLHKESIRSAALGRNKAIRRPMRGNAAPSKQQQQQQAGSVTNSVCGGVPLVNVN